MSYSLGDLLDIPRVQKLLDSLNAAFPFPSAIIDNDARVLTATAWQDVCTKFHRVHPQCAHECRESDRHIVDRVEEGDPSIVYRCPRGLTDAATPIIIDGNHLGNVFTGQLFLEPPDLAFFRAQARAFGFDEAAYLEAVSRVPVMTPLQLERNLKIVRNLVELLCESGLARVNEIATSTVLKNAATSWSATFDAIADAICLLDVEGRVVRCNRAYSRLARRSFPEILGQRHLDLIGLAPTLDQEHPVACVRDGVTEMEIEGRQYRCAVDPVHDADGAVTQVVCTLSDISERRKVEAELAASENRFRTLTRFAPVGIFEADVNGGCLYVNDEWQRITGLTMAEATGTGWSRALHPDDRDKIVGAWSAAAATGTIFDEEYRFLTTGGAVNWVHCRATAMVGDDGRPHGYLGTVTDITESRRSQEEARRERAYLERLFESAPEAIVLTTTDGRALQVNSRFVAMFGYPDDEVIGHLIDDLVASPEHAAEAHSITQTVGAGNEIAVETLRRRKDGTTIAVSILGAPIELGGEQVAVFAIYRDITERRAREAALRESEETFAKAFHHAPVMMTLSNVDDDTYYDINQQFVEASGFTREEAVGATSLDLGWMSADDRARLAAELEEQGRVSGTELEFTAKNGTKVACIFSGEIVNIAQRARLLSIAQDITQRKKLATDLRTRLELLSVLSRAKDSRDLIRSAIDLFRTRFGCEAAGVRLRDGDDFPYLEARGFPPEFVEAERHLCTVDAAGGLLRDASGNPVLECMCGNVIRGRFDPAKPFFTANGSFWTNSTTALLASTNEADRKARTRNRCNGEGYESVALVPLRTGGEIFGLIQLNDSHSGRFTSSLITLAEQLSDEVAIALAHRRAEEALRESEERYRHFFEDDLTGDFVSTAAGTIVDCNPAFARIFGFENRAQALRTDEVDLFPSPAAREKLLKQLRREGRLSYHELEMRRHDGSPVHVVANLFADHDRDRVHQVTRGYLLDMTQKRELEEQLRHAQKIEAVGSLAGGVAHDFNNLLQGMLSTVQVLRTGALEPDRAAIRLVELEENIRRGAQLTRQLLVFSRREITTRDVIDLNTVVEASGTMLRRLLRENITLELDLGVVPLPVLADRGQIEQVLMNLAVNAADAMPNGGRLTIQTSRAGHAATIRVGDTGTGMPEEIRHRIFEPYFTTKGVGKGTGLGLAVVHGIVATHDGHIHVESELEVGTTFELTFSIVGETVPTSPTAIGGTTLGTLVQGSGARVLVVEDEEGARDGLREILTALGYVALAVESGEKAGELPVDPPFDVLLTDLVLPGVSGSQLAVRLGARWPGLKVILMSGYTQNDLIQHDIDVGTVRFLQKPFDMETLARCIFDALRAGQP